jgi:hypothetical protein
MWPAKQGGLGTLSNQPFISLWIFADLASGLNLLAAGKKLPARPVR